MLSLLPLPSFAAQTFDLAYDSFEDRNGNGTIDCTEQVFFRVALFGTGAPQGGDSGTITVPVFRDGWTYQPGSFQLDPVFNDTCAVSIVSGNAPTDPALVLDYTCDPLSGNPLDDNYALVFRVSGRFFSNTSGALTVEARNARTSPTSEIQTDIAIAGDPTQPCPPAGNPDVRTTKTLVSGSGDPGATLVYNLAISNAGNRQADGVLLTETVPVLATFLPASSSPGWSCTPNNNAGSTCVLGLGSLAPGASTSRTFAVQLAPAFPTSLPPSIDNTACASTATEGDPAGNNCGSVSTPPRGNPDLRLSKTFLSGSGNPGATLVYQLAVSNQGNRDAAGVTLQENVPLHARFSPSGSAAGWTCSPNANAGAACTLSVGPLAAGASVTRTFAIVIDATLPANPGNIENTACASTSTPGDPAADNCGSTSTPPGGNPDLEIVKTMKSGTTTPGDRLVYQLTLTNRGNRGADNAILRETVPAATSWDSAASSPGWSCTGTAPGSTCFLPVGTVPAAASLSRDFAIRIANPLPPGTAEIANTACVDAAPSDPSANNCSTITKPPGGNPDLHLVKTLLSGTVAPDAVLLYRLTLSNEGNRAAKEVALQETVPAHTTFEAAASSPGWTCSPGPGAGALCTLPVGVVPAGATSTFEFAVRAQSSLPPDASIGNTACATQTAGEGDPPGNNCGTVITDPPQRPKTDVEVFLDVDEPLKQLGEEFAFVLTVRNASDVPAHDLRITVMLPAFGTPPAEIDSACTSIDDLGLECSLPSLAPGQQVGLTWHQAAARAGSYTIAADLAAAEPEDIDSTPGNALRTEDDFAEVQVEATVQPILHDVPTLSSIGLVSMVLLLLGGAVVHLRSRRTTAGLGA